MIANKGIKSLLRILEDGACNDVMASSSLLFDQSIIPVSSIQSAYSVIKLIVKDFKLLETFGSAEQWERLLKDIAKNSKSLKNVFDANHIDEAVLNDLAYYATGLEYKNWLVFLFLKEHCDTFSNLYLKKIIESTSSFEDLKKNLLVGITSLSHKDPSFKVLYDDRKRLLKDFPEEDIAIFVKKKVINLKDLEGFSQELIDSVTELLNR